MRRLLSLLADPERIRPEMRPLLLVLLAAAVWVWAEAVDDPRAGGRGRADHRG